MGRALRACAVLVLAASGLAVAPGSRAAEPWREVELGRILLEIPGGWTAVRQPRGRWTVEDPSLRSWTLAVESAEFSAEPNRPEMALIEAIAQREAQRAVAERGGSVETADTDIGEKLVMHDYLRLDDGALQRVRAWHRFAVRGFSVVVAHFTFVAPDELADDRATLAALDLIGQSVVNAELITRPGEVPSAAR
jgi:hypothetical protein